MTIFSFSSAILLLLVCSSDALEGNSEGQPQSLTDTICAGRPRSQCDVELDVPSACATTGNVFIPSCPIVFFLHGAGGNNDNFKNRSGVHEAGYIGVYPQGEAGWNTGPKNSNNCDWTDYSCTTDPDEGDLVKAIIAEIRSQGGTGNVYVSGTSNGAALAHRLAANGGTELPIKGIIATVTQLLSSPPRSGPGTLNYNQPSSSRGNPAVSILSIMGTDDDLIPYEGGSSGVFGGDDSFQLMPALTSMSTWATHNGCSGSYTNSEFSSDQGDNTATLYDYSAGCPPGVLVEHYAVNGGKHNAGGAKIDGARIDPLDFVARVEAGGTPGPPNPPPSPPAPSPTPPGSCINDASWRGKFNDLHTCDHVARDPTIRCSWESSDNVSANVACVAACDPNCATSPGPSSAPSTAPCSNVESFTFLVGKKNKEVGCSWIKNGKRRGKYCTVPAVSASCPLECNSCPGCQDDSEFEFGLKNKNKSVTCEWIANGKKPDKRRKQYCKDESDILLACPLSCGTC
uniref:Feruloyl esterase n=2 Tax=Chaetoceros debilis TaxID=122233 RepID=A0A7S3QAT6_9STRA